MSTEDEKKEERKKKKKQGEQMVIELTEIFPLANFQHLIQSVEKTKARSKDEAVEYYLTNFLSLDTNNDNKKHEIVKKVESPKKELPIKEEKIEFTKTDIKQEIELKKIDEKQEDDEYEKEILRKAQEMEKELKGLQLEQILAFKKLYELFPFFKLEDLKSILEKKKWSYEDAASFFVEKLEDLSIDRDDDDDFDENALEVVIESDFKNQDWYKEALESSADFVKSVQKQDTSEDELFAKKLQEEEYSKFAQRMKDEEKREIEEIERQFKEKERLEQRAKLEKEKKEKIDRGINPEEELESKILLTYEKEGEKEKKNVKIYNFKDVIIQNPEYEHSSFNPDLLWKSYANTIIEKFKPYKVEEIKNIVNPKLASRFILEMKRKNSFPVMCFHGTNNGNINSIINTGLKVPGKSGIRVVNGSAYGVGIYVAMGPHMSISYCAGGNKMFVCAALVGKNFTTANHGTFMVVFNEAHVLPVFTVKFKNENYDNSNYTPFNSSVNINKLMSSGNPNQKRKKK